MATLKVSDAGGGLLEVRELPGEKWWTVSTPNVLGERLILTSGSRPVSTDGPTGRRILAAAAEFETPADS